MKVKVTGIKDIDKKLLKLEPKVGKKLMNKALRETQKKVMMPAVKNNTPTDSGTMKKNVTVRAGKRSRYKKSMNVLFKDDVMEDFYPRFVEYGAPNAGIEPTGFMRKSFDQKKESVKKMTEDKIRQLIDEETKKS